MDASTTSGVAAIAKIRAVPTPHRVRVSLEDGSTTYIAPSTKKRWKSRLGEILDSMPWTSIEPLDIKDTVIGPRIDNTESEGATDLEDISLGSLGKDGTNLMSLLVAMQKLQLKGQEVALTHQARAYSSVMENNAKLLSVISDRLNKMETNRANELDVMTSLHNRLAMEIHKGGDGEEEAGNSLDEFAAKVVAQVMSSKLGPAPQAPPAPNGSAEPSA